MMPVSTGDRVILTRDGNPAGKVTSMVDDETAYVALDGGTRCAFRVDELVPETKTWPPRGIETK